MLVFAGIATALTFVLLVLIPPYGIIMIVIDGFLLLCSVAIFYFFIPNDDIGMFVEGIRVEFRFGVCFYVTLIAGSLNLVSGSVMWLLLRLECFKTISTFFELDYDTPWNDKRIREDSKRTKLETLSTQFYVDSTLRGSMRRFREKCKRMRRSRSHDSGVAIVVAGGESEKSEQKSGSEGFLVVMNNVNYQVKFVAMV